MRDMKRGPVRKTSLNLPEGLWKALRMQAFHEGRHAQVIVAELIEKYLARKAKKGGSPR